MKFIRKHLKLIVFIITCILIYIIYINNSNVKRINYISLGDGYASGINSYGEKNYGYSDYLKDYLNSNNKLNNYCNYSSNDMKIKDLYNDILINKQSINNESMKQALRDANILTISIGLNDLIYRKSIQTNNIGNKEDIIIQNIMIDLDELITEIKKYYKYEIYIIWYYNFYPQNSVENKLLNKLNIKYKQFSKKNNLIYIDNSNMNSNLKLYLNNPNSHFPNIEGYKKIYSNILMDLEVWFTSSFML